MQDTLERSPFAIAVPISIAAVFIVSGLAAWSLWLGREGRGPRAVRHLAWALPVFALIGGIVTGISLSMRFMAVAGARMTPEERREQLAAVADTSVHHVIVMGAVLGLAFLTLAGLTIKHRASRTHVE